jgi:hypothetical protein
MREKGGRGRNEKREEKKALIKIWERKKEGMERGKEKER